ncbi:MFS transporter [bacterium LRH843]|nr:MFS transporter [bacterium LRH843]
MQKEQPFYIVYFIGLLPFIMVVGNSMYIPLLPKLQLELGLTMAESGWILTSFSIPAAILVPFSGIASDRYGRKRVALLALPLIMIGCILSALAGSSIEWMIAGRVLQGVGAGGVTPLAMAFVTDLYTGSRRNEALGIIEVFNGLGKVVSPIIGGFILAFSWYSSFVVYFAITLFAFTGILLNIRERKVAEKELEQISVKFSRLKRLLIQHWKWIVPIFMSGFIGMFLLFGYLLYLSYVLGTESPVKSVWNGLILAIPLLALTVSSYLTGRTLQGREDSYKRGFIYGAGLMIIGTWSMIHLPVTVLVIVWMTLYGCGFGIVLPSANAALATVVTNKERGTVFALYSMFRFFGVALGPLLFGLWLHDPKQMLFTASFFVSLIGLSLLISWSCFPIGKSCSTPNPT